MAQNKLTDAQFISLLSYYDDPSPQCIYCNNTEALEQAGYIERAGKYPMYRLTQAGLDYINDLKQKVENHNLAGTTATQREWLVMWKLKPENESDRQLLFSIIDTDRSSRVRDRVLYEFQNCSRAPLSREEWNRLAHNTDKQIRFAAAKEADPMELADETDDNVIGTVIRAHRDNIPRKLVSHWYERNITAATSAMTSPDIDRMLDDRNFDMLQAMAGSKPKLFTTEQGERMKALFDETNDYRLRRALDRLLWDGYGIPESALREHADDVSVYSRLEGYRKAYIYFRKAERMFADPDCQLAREQRRIAEEESANENHL